MRILVTGGSGFIGRMLVPALVVAGHQVYAPCRPDGVDLETPETYAPWLRACDVLIHLAAHNPSRLSTAALNRPRFTRINVEGTRAIARLARNAGITHFVFLSSVRVYGISTDDTPLGENAALSANDAYGRSKIVAEAALAEAFADRPRSLTILRPPVVYGPGRAGVLDLVARFVRNGWPLPSGFLEARKSVLSVENLADAIRHILDTGVAGIFNVADEGTITLGEFADILARSVGQRVCRVPMVAGLLENLPFIGPPARHLAAPLVLDTGALRSTGWVPEHLGAQGLAEIFSAMPA